MSDGNEHQKDEALKAARDAQMHAAKDADLMPETMTEDEILAALGDREEDMADTAGQGSDAEAGFSSPLEALAAENHRQEDEIKELNEKLLRTAAEMENLRRRTQKEVADAREFSITKFAREMLGVADNLRRALDHVDEADKEQPSLKTLVEGVEMTERELLNGMEKHGVRMISPKGEKFDPNFHQAMFEVQNPEVPNNTVMEVVQVGYVIGERVLRPAMVGVAKGGPKVAAQNGESSQA